MNPLNHSTIDVLFESVTHRSRWLLLAWFPHAPLVLGRGNLDRGRTHQSEKWALRLPYCNDRSGRKWSAASVAVFPVCAWALEQARVWLATEPRMSWPRNEMNSAPLLARHISDNRPVGPAAMIDSEFGLGTQSREIPVFRTRK